MSLELKIFIACAAFQAMYYLFFFLRLNFVRGFSGLPGFLPPASVVICARNEAANLQQFLKIVLIQQYPQFEVIVVNDESTDNTIDVLVEYYKRNKNLKLINVPAGTPKPYGGKKFALQKGIEAATFETVVVTDADCRPATTHWLAKMVGAYMNDTQIVLGHSPYERSPGFLNKLIRYENILTALQYFGFAKAGLPYMGVGRNLSYKKSLFTAFKGFEKKKHLLTGDDDLFVNAAATRKNTEVCIDKDAFMFTKAETTFSGWLNQKRRHLRSGFSYRFYHQALLFLFALSKLALLVLLVWLLAKGESRMIVLGTTALVILVQWLSTFTLYRKFASADLKLWSPVLDILYTFYLVLIFFLLLLKPKDNWKN